MSHQRIRILDIAIFVGTKLGVYRHTHTHTHVGFAILVSTFIDFYYLYTDLTILSIALLQPLSLNLVLTGDILHFYILR